MLTDARSRRLAAILTALLLPAALFAYRLAIPVRYMPPEGGSRLFVPIPVLYVLPILAGLIAMLADFAAVRRVAKTRWAWIGFACLAIDVAVYLFAGYTERSFKLTSALVLPVFAMLGSILVGVYLQKWRPRAVDGLLATAMAVSVVASVAQLTQRAGLSTPVGRWMVAWDEFAADRFHNVVHLSRAEGFELNPNIFAPMAVVGVIWALFGMPKGRLRTVTLVSAILITVLSMSRTIMLVMVAILAVVVVREISSERLKGAAPLLLRIGIILAVLLAGMLLLRFGPYEISDRGLVRRSEGIEIETPETDLGVGSRIDAWRSSWEAIKDNPWGHLEGYREFTKPLSHPHNEVLFRLLYGGPLWLFVHLAFLAWLAFWLSPASHRWTGPAIAAALAVNGITEPLFKMVPYTVLLYVIVGALVWEKLAGSQTRSSHSA